MAFEGAERGLGLWEKLTGFSRGAFTTKRLNVLALAFGLFCVVLASVWGLKRPAHNWDMLAYVASALENRVHDAETLHQLTWEAVSEGASEAQLNDLKHANAYNEANWQNPEALKSQLVMFRVKVAYVWFIRAMEPYVGVAKASILASVVPSFLFGLVLIAWLWREKAIQALVFVMPVLFMGDYLHMSIAVIPDMAHALVTLLALWAIARFHVLLGLILMIVSVAVRPDSIILSFALLIVLPFFGYRILPLLAGFAAAFVLAEFIGHWGGHIGWWPHFYFSNIQLQPIMNGFHPDFSIHMWIKGYIRSIMVMAVFSEWPWLFLALLAGGLIAVRNNLWTDRRLGGLFVAMAIGNLGKFAVFPLPDDRFYFAQIAVMAIILALVFKPDFSKSPVTNAA